MNVKVKGVEVELTSMIDREPFPLISTTNTNRLQGEPATKQKVSLIAALLLLLLVLSTKKYDEKNLFHGSTANTNTATAQTKEAKEESAKSLSWRAFCSSH